MSLHYRLWRQGIGGTPGDEEYDRDEWRRHAERMLTRFRPVSVGTHDETGEIHLMDEKGIALALHVEVRPGKVPRVNVRAVVPGMDEMPTLQMSDLRCRSCGARTYPAYEAVPDMKCWKCGDGSVVKPDVA